ncbi:MAG TPA: cyclic pyranopterin monophosphate synthase MoaC [Dyella sp.]|uniref:cyclic pyranopterin monophosphate synthase MoaC n=1 Tax=Dyella sp. TaxID=1869338 RepID=UPI002F952AD7
MLSHVDENQQPRMVDVSGKAATHRVARAQARLGFPAEVASALREAGYVTPKGAVITVAQIAGVMGAKATPQLIPLCHPLAIERCRVDIHIEGDDAVIECEVACRGTTGVEMEALTGASVAALTIYDMCKAMSHAMVIREVRLLAKSGGKRDIDLTEPRPE